MLIARKADSTPEEQARALEKAVHELLEKSAVDAVKGDMNAGALLRDCTTASCRSCY